MQLAPGTCVATAKEKNIRGEGEEDKGQSELGYAKGFGVSRTKKTSPNLIDFRVSPESLEEVNKLPEPETARN